ncbi:hypothetical protein PFISCL1PPCAC_21498, partial [Pristionchus fissidentatus]
ISRCLDLTDQVQKMGKIQLRKLDERRDLVESSLQTIRKTYEIVESLKLTSTLSSQLELQKSALTMCNSVQISEKFVEGPILTIYTSPNILFDLASFGDVITANLIDDSGSTQQVSTQRTALVKKKSVDGRGCYSAFCRLHTALKDHLSYSDQGFSSITMAAEPSIVLPPQREAIRILYSTDRYDGTPRYQLDFYSKTTNLQVAAVAASGLDESPPVLERMTENGSSDKGDPDLVPLPPLLKRVAQTEKRPFIEDLPASLKGWKPVQPEPKISQGWTDYVKPTSSKTMRIDATSEKDTQNYGSNDNPPGPSSQKKIKKEEEEEMDSNLVEDLMSFAKVCDAAMKKEDESAAIKEDEMKVEVDEGGE